MTAVDLTPSQAAAVEHQHGPLLVLAGPGSGKTRVITRRIARLVERGVSPREILAITFTNKASREMAERVNHLLPGTRVWVSTFHRFCARLLREYGGELGLRSNFSIFDMSDQHQLLKQAMHDLDIDTTHFPPNKIAHQISQSKNELITAEQFSQGFEERVGNHLQAIVARVYPEYQRRLLAANAVDFDDLLVHVALLLAQNDELRRELDLRFRYILVDEYQDTNRAQYQIIAALSQIEPNLCATGDPDQSIYGWRGARIENILRFEREFSAVKVIRLEENFRSTPEILATADQLIAHNRQRKPKVLKAVHPTGEPVELRLYEDGRQEAEAIAAEIRELVRSGQRRWSDFAIFYRVNSLSRVLETTLARHKISHQVAGGVAFYERTEIKDLIAYLRLIENPQDRIAFLRIVNTPARGIGKTTVDKLARWADSRNVSLFDAAREARNCPGLSKRAVVAMSRFIDLMDDLVQRSAGPVAELLRQVLVRTRYATEWTDSPNEDEVQRLSNVEELVSAARQYDEQGRQAGEDDDRETPSLGGFLETASLTQDIDSLDAEEGAVTLMTLHAAKGLEFPVVYLVAVEQNILPHERSLRENDVRQLEEERRLLFVGITRAEQKLILTHTLRRELHGRSLSTIPSDFLPELDVVRRDCSLGMTFADEFSDSFEDSSAPSSATPRSPSSPVDRLKASLKLGSGKPFLTTGAALESGQRDTVDIPTGFGQGMQVRHPRYGLGHIVEVGGYSRHRTVTVEFHDGGRRESFIVAKSPLQPVG